MWVLRRFSVVCWSPLFPHRLLSTGFPSASQVKTIVSSEENNFMTWLRNRGENEACESVAMGMSAHGRGLFAIKQIKAGQHILKISKNLIITPDKLHDEVKDLLHENVSSYAQLALLILAEQYSGQASKWAPYISCLPQIGSLNNTVLWSDKELEMLQCSSRAYQQSLHSRRAILEDFVAVKHVLQQCPYIFGENVSYASFRHAYALVNSRAWRIDELNTVALLPFVDFLNHDVSCKSFLSFDQENNYAEVVADRDYAAGEQVLVSYGRYGNDILAETFGFTVEDNPYDQVDVWMGLSEKDILRKEKLELLRAHGMVSLSDVRNLDSGGITFVIKEVKSAKGRGRGIPQSIRAFSRVLCASSKEELAEMANQASELDGRLARQPLKDTCKEIGAMLVLLTHIKSLVQDRMEALLVLEMEDSYWINPRLVIRKEMAKDILGGELRVLRSASDWLKHHCDGLIHFQNIS